MADAKITELDANTTPASSDLTVIVDDPAGTPATQQITLVNFFKVVNSLTALGATPAATDRLLVIDDPAGTPVAKYMTASNMAALAKLGSLYIPAGSMMLPATTPASGINQTEASTNDQNQVTCDFADGSTTYAEAEVVMPSDYDGGTFTASFYWRATGTSTNSVRWQVEARSYGDAETLDQAFGTAQAVDDAHTSTASQVLISAATGACTASGTPAGNELMHFRFGRLGGHANDNLAVTVSLMGVLITYTRS
jgi:hypothetical protein